MGADHINYEEEMNQQYKTPTVLVNTWMRIAWFLFVVPGFMIMCNMDDMVRVFVPHKYSYMGNETDTVNPTRYETLYLIDYIPKFWFLWNISHYHYLVNSNKNGNQWILES